MDKLKNILDVRFWKFVLVGIANTVVGTGVMFICYNALGQSYWVSSALNYVVGSILSYFLNKYFTFQSRKKSWKEVVRFVVNISICYLIAYGLAKPLVAYGMQGMEKAVQENVAMLAGMGLFVILNYLGQRVFVFRVSDKISAE